MGLLDLFKRTASGQTTPLSTTQVDSNWQKIMDLFPTPAAGTTDVGKVPALKADKTGFNYAPVISSIIPGANISIDVTDPNNPVISAINEQVFNVLKDGALVGQSSSLNFKGGSVNVTKDVTGGKIDVEVIGSGGDIFITKTKAEIDTLISTNALVKGATYKITGVHPTLYDDGTNSGTAILLKAISENVLETQGTGIFYNPKYNKSVDGFGIWDNKMYGTFSTIVGTFDYQNKEAVTANNAATGMLLADGMIQWVSGDWSTATSITGDVSSATATVAGFVTPTYSIGDKVIWGGYSWTNVNGNVGASTDVLNLDSEWSKDVYDTTNYNLAYDVIEYDYANDMIIRRHDLISNIDVRFDKGAADLFTNYYSIAFNAISVQQFGNPFNLVVGKGILNKYIDNGYDESINFSGSSQQNLTFGAYSRQNNLTFGQSSSQNNLTFGAGSRQQNLTFGANSGQYDLTFGAGSRQQNLTFGANSGQNNLTFGAYSSQNNLTFGQGSYQQNLTFGAYSSQNTLTFGTYSSQYNLTFGANSGQFNLTFGTSSYQSNLTFGVGSYQDNLIFGTGSYQQNLTFGAGSQVDFNNQTLNSNMGYVEFKTMNFTVPDLSSATYIFDSNIKEVYQRPDGTIKLKFMNNSDVLEVHGIAD
jgi:hypothetical protein